MKPVSSFRRRSSLRFRARLLSVLALPWLASACGGRGTDSTPTGPSAGAAAAVPAPAPAPPASPGATTFAIGLPIRRGESQNAAFGLNPFGVHIGDHSIDGHPGWDIEYVPGATVTAAAAGEVQSVVPSEGSSNYGIQITHRVDGREAYRTIYGVASVAPGVTPGAAVAAGQALGVIGSQTRTIGTITVTYGFTHFQLDDFGSNDGLTNVHAVPPERFLTPAARQELDAIWRGAFYPQEFVEPFLANPRNVSFPMSRVWARQTGNLAPRLEFTRESAFAREYGYVMRDSSGAAVETGTLQIEALAKPVSTLDFVPRSGQRRRGVYSIVDGTMQLDYGEPGAPRPTDLRGAATYTTAR